MMSKTNFAASVAVIALVSVTMTYAQERSPLSLTESVTVKATIEDIDKTNRIIKLKGPEGNLVWVLADEKMKRFDELKVGDVVTATYSESVAVHLRKPGEPEPDKERVIVRPQGGKPGAKVENVKSMTVIIEDINRKASSVKVKDPDGNVHSFRVREPKRLEGVNVGDKVDIYYTVALLLKVD
jgi:hypothetical protein